MVKTIVRNIFNGLIVKAEQALFRKTGMADPIIIVSPHPSMDWATNLWGALPISGLQQTVDAAILTTPVTQPALKWVTTKFAGQAAGELVEGAVGKLGGPVGFAISPTIEIAQGYREKDEAKISHGYGSLVGGTSGSWVGGMVAGGMYGLVTGSETLNPFVVAGGTLLGGMVGAMGGGEILEAQAKAEKQRAFINAVARNLPDASKDFIIGPLVNLNRKAKDARDAYDAAIKPLEEEAKMVTSLKDRMDTITANKFGDHPDFKPRLHINPYEGVPDIAANDPKIEALRTAHGDSETLFGERIMHAARLDKEGRAAIESIVEHASPADKATIRAFYDEIDKHVLPDTADKLPTFDAFSKDPKWTFLREESDLDSVVKLKSASLEDFAGSKKNYKNLAPEQLEVLKKWQVYESLTLLPGDKLDLINDPKKLESYNQHARAQLVSKIISETPGANAVQNPGVRKIISEAGTSDPAIAARIQKLFEFSQTISPDYDMKANAEVKGGITTMLDHRAELAKSLEKGLVELDSNQLVKLADGVHVAAMLAKASERISPDGKHAEGPVTARNPHYAELSTPAVAAKDQLAEAKITPPKANPALSPGMAV